MHASLSKIFKALTQQILRLTLYDMIRDSRDFEDVRAALNDRTEWSIELFRSCLTIHFGGGSTLIMLCALSLLLMAESVHIYYGRLSPAELKEWAERVGYATFAILFAVLDIGSIIVRILGLFVLSGSPALATSLVLISVSPSVILPVLTYPVRLLRLRKSETTGEVEMESGTAVDRSGN